MAKYDALLAKIKEVDGSDRTDANKRRAYASIARAEIKKVRAAPAPGGAAPSYAAIAVRVSRTRGAVKAALGEDHPSADYFKLTKEEYEGMRTEYAETVTERQLNPTRIKNWQAFIDRSVDLINSDKYVDVAIGLALLTGRRIFELVGQSYTDLSPAPLNGDPAAKSRYHVLFKGQAKTKESEGNRSESAYKIPVLADAKVVISAFRRLREDLAPHLVGKTSQELNAAISKYLGKRFSEKYSDLWPEGYKASLRDLRALYAEISSRVFNKTGTNEEVQKPNRFYASILGHSHLDLNTANSYQAFVIGDYEPTDLIANIRTEE